MKEKGTTLKEGWSFLSTGLDVQRAMVDMEKRQERGDLGEEEMRQLEQELSGTLLLVAWKGSKFELGAVLRQVVDLGECREAGDGCPSMLLLIRPVGNAALSKESPSVTDAMLMNRAKVRNPGVSHLSLQDFTDFFLTPPLAGDPVHRRHLEGRPARRRRR